MISWTAPHYAKFQCFPVPLMNSTTAIQPRQWRLRVAVGVSLRFNVHTFREAPTGNAVKDFLQRKHGANAVAWKQDAIEPGTGFTTKPGVAATRRTPGCDDCDSNPTGVSHGRLRIPGTIVEPHSGFEHWTLIGTQGAPLHGDPGLCCVTPLGFSNQRIAALIVHEGQKTAQNPCVVVY